MYGGTTDVFGDLICEDPFIVCEENFITHSRTYYWIENSSLCKNSGWGAGATCRSTGEYRTYNGITCKVMTAVKINGDSLEKQISNCEKRIKELKKPLVRFIKIYGFDNKGGSSLSVGDSKSLKWGLYEKNQYKSNVEWISSDPDIISIDDKGVVTAKKEGKATITATVDTSNKKDKIVIYSIKEFFGEADDRDNWDED